MDDRPALYVGIDVGKHWHQAAFVGPDGKDLAKALRFANTAEGYAAFKGRLEAAVRGGRVRIALEATGHYWMALYQRLNDDGHEVVVFNPMQTHAFTNTSIRGAKTDRVDARRIAQLLRQEQLPATVKPDEDRIALRELTRLRSRLAHRLAEDKNRLLGILDRAFPEYEAVFGDVFGVASLALLKEYPLPALIAGLDVGRLTELLFQASRRHLGREKAEQVHAAARTSFGLRMAHEVLAQEVRLFVQSIGFIEGQMKQLDGQIRGILAAEQELLATVPGVGPIVAATILAELGDVPRFAGAKDPAKAVVAVAGLDPKSADSGQRAGYRRMSKRGSPYLRQAFYQAAFAAWQHDAMLGALYRKKLAEGKPHRVALNAVANKLCHIVYACLRDRRPYEARDPAPKCPSDLMN
jgi:transposase